jgi:hypothetical protein
MPAYSQDCHRFVNALKILHSIDQDQAVQAGILKEGDLNGWITFCANPYLWMVRADDNDRMALWQIIEGRQPPKALEGVG